MGILSALETYAIEDQLVKDRASLAAMLADRAAGKDVRDSDIRIWTQAVDRGSRQLEKIRFQKALDADRAENDRIHHRERVQNANEIARRSDQLENECRLERESANLEKRKQFESDFHASKSEIVEWLEALNNGEDIEERYEISPLEAIQCAVSWTSSKDMALMPASFLRAHNWLKYGTDKKNEFWGDEKYAAFDVDDFEDEEDYRWVASRHNFEKILHEALNPWDDVTRFSLDIEYDYWPIDKEYNLTGPMTLEDGKLVWAGESTKRRGILFLCGNESTHSLEVFRKASMPLPERIEAPGDFNLRGDEERRGGELSRSVYPWVFMDNTGDYLTVIDVPSSINTLYQYDEKSDSFEKKSEFG